MVAILKVQGEGETEATTPPPPAKPFLTPSQKRGLIPSVAQKTRLGLETRITSTEEGDGVGQKSTASHSCEPPKFWWLGAPSFGGSDGKVVRLCRFFS